jgi:hypothetical protein
MTTTFKGLNKNDKSLAITTALFSWSIQPELVISTKLENTLRQQSKALNNNNNNNKSLVTTTLLFSWRSIQPKLDLYKA